MSDLLNMIPNEMQRAGANEYTGPCPRCGGEDRFSVTIKPSAPGGALFQCKGASVGRAGCDWAGDGITFLRDYYGYSYSDARFELGLEPDEWTEGEEDELSDAKRKEKERQKRREREEMKRMIRHEWLKDRMTISERVLYDEAKRPPRRVEEIREQIDSLMEEHYEHQASGKIGANGTRPLSRMRTERISLQFIDDLPPSVQAEVRGLAREAQYTQKEIQEIDQQVESVFERVEKRLAADGISFEDYWRGRND
jgi:hypothetical protein